MEDGLLYGLTTGPLVLWLHDLRRQWYLLKMHWLGAAAPGELPGELPAKQTARYSEVNRVPVSICQRLFNVKVFLSARQK